MDIDNADLLASLQAALGNATSAAGKASAPPDSPEGPKGSDEDEAKVSPSISAKLRQYETLLNR